ncbi:putative VP1 [Microviridae sp.]|nr:putative VP1 [Microviridae sp.]
MSSLIPKQSVGIDSRKYRRNQSCMVHGTSEIGYVLPTYARNYINDATINLSTRTGVRLSPLFVPTMGKLDVRHYHCFVPWNRCYAPFDAFLAREPFNFTSNARIPEVLPRFQVGVLLTHLFTQDSLMPDDADRNDFSLWVESGQFNVGLTASVYRANLDGSKVGTFELVDWENSTDVVSMADEVFSTHINDKFPHTSFAVSSIFPSMLRTAKKNFFLKCRKQIVDGERTVTCFAASTVGDVWGSHIVSDYMSSISFPSLDACDFSYEIWRPDGDVSSVYRVCFNFNGAIKRLRSAFLGLGYSFNPFDEEPVTPLKLFAYYRAWYSLFGVTRDSNFNDTDCAWIYRFLSSYYLGSSEIMSGSQSLLDATFVKFIKGLSELTYTCPSDYFTSSVQNTQQGVSNDAAYLTTGSSAPFEIGYVRAQSDMSPSAPVYNAADGQRYVSAISIQIANRLLRWVNKNTVVGRKIADILYARYGKIKTDDDSSEGVYRVGVDDTPVEIGIIFNQTSSEGSAPLGEFSGIGSGGSRASKHTFVTPSYGVFITLTAVVPEMGYFQGMLRENSDGVRDSYEFPDSAFDAVGWQSVRYNELVADRQYQVSAIGDSASTQLGVYGRQPRYTHVKVGFNRVLGDISLPHMAQNMLSYTLDRYFNPRDGLVPINDPVISRRGTIGGSNRIFEVTSPTDDHIIYQIYFDISVNDRLKPLALSYDTILEGDNKAVDFGHQ